MVVHWLECLVYSNLETLDLVSIPLLNYTRDFRCAILRYFAWRTATQGESQKNHETKPAVGLLSND